MCKIDDKKFIKNREWIFFYFFIIIFDDWFLIIEFKLWVEYFKPPILYNSFTFRSLKSYLLIFWQSSLNFTIIFLFHFNCLITFSSVSISNIFHSLINFYTFTHFFLNFISLHLNQYSIIYCFIHHYMNALIYYYCYYLSMILSSLSYSNLYSHFFISFFLSFH
jgi:hypothetical protein